jgi:predicted lipoprotein with Yx(FWY)xxD motif
MLRKSVLAAVLAVALAAAGVAAAAAVTHPQSLRSLAASHSNKASGTKITLHKTSVGKVLATGSGVTLYLFKADHGKKSNCYGQCASYWPPEMKKGKLSAGKGVKAKLLGTTKRKNGKLQVTYKGHPLYRFKLDKGSGQDTGQGQNFFGGKWFVVSASGAANTKAPPSTGTTTSTTTNSTTTRYTTTYRY